MLKSGLISTPLISIVMLCGMYCTTAFSNLGPLGIWANKNSTINFLVQVDVHQYAVGTVYVAAPRDKLREEIPQVNTAYLPSEKASPRKTPNRLIEITTSPLAAATTNVGIPEQIVRKRSYIKSVAMTKHNTQNSRDKIITHHNTLKHAVGRTLMLARHYHGNKPTNLYPLPWQQTNKLVSITMATNQQTCIHGKTQIQCIRKATHTD